MNILWAGPPSEVPLSREVYDMISAIVCKDTNYWVTDIDSAAAEYRALVNPDAGMTEFVVFSLRGNLLKDKIVRGHFRIRSSLRRLAAAYEQETIITLARKYDYPPVPLLKAIFVHRANMSTSDIDDLFRSACTTSTCAPVRARMSMRDLAQIDLAKSCDADLNSGAERARAHELQFVALFKEFPHKTEADLILEQSKTTPDLLFTVAVVINGSPVNWIDYKDYVGTPNTFLTGKLRQQALKYTLAYGPGAFVFNGGYVDGTSVGAMLLRAQDCPIGTFSPS